MLPRPKKDALLGGVFNNVCRQGDPMTTFPETRASLVLRTGDATDAAAWEEFVRLYQPAIY